MTGSQSISESAGELSHVPLSVDPLHLTHPECPPVSKYIWAGFIEHLGRCVYGGVVDDPKNPSPRHLLVDQEGGRLGWRRDVIDMMRELNVPMMRWPGGNFVSGYRWTDGIGPIEEREKTISPAWNDVEYNLFGTDEFMKWCRHLEMEPYFCLNMGNGTLEDAMAWLEYCNGTQDTKWANLRRKNTGQDEPYGIKYWGLGNEMWGRHQIGASSASDYAKKAQQWGDALRKVDPDIKLVLCGNSGSRDWDREVLAIAIDGIDYHSIHFYSGSGFDNPDAETEYIKNVFCPLTAERNIEACKSLIDLANVERFEKGLPAKNIGIAYDEWNVTHQRGSGTDKPHRVGTEPQYDFQDALAFVGWCHVLVRKSNEVPLANLAQSVNILSPIVTKPDGIVKTTIYEPLRIFSNHMRDGQLIDLNRMPDVYTGVTNPVWLQQVHHPLPWVDTCAMLLQQEGTRASVRISILNRHPHKNWADGLTIGHFTVDSATVYEMYADDLAARNTFENPNGVKVTSQTLNGEQWHRHVSQLSVRKHSWKFVVLEGVVE